MPIDPSTAFVSYSREDIDFVLRLARDLKAKGAKVWMDRIDIRPGQRWEAEIEFAVSSCSRLLVILSPASIASRNVLAEAALALDEGKEVIPVLIRECKVPFRLRPLQYADFSTSYANGLEELVGVLTGEQREIPGVAGESPLRPEARLEAEPALPERTELEHNAVEDRTRQHGLERQSAAAEPIRASGPPSAKDASPSPQAAKYPAWLKVGFVAVPVILAGWFLHRALNRPPESRPGVPPQQSQTIQPKESQPQSTNPQRFAPPHPVEPPHGTQQDQSKTKPAKRAALPESNVAPSEQSQSKGLEANKLSPPGTVRMNPQDGLKYVWIPSGTFTMGCSPGDRCAADEMPHRVTISKGFWLGQTEVTQAAYERMTRTNPSHFRGENLPVEDVSWDEANSYCRAVGGRLPTEAEWEWAARAGTSEPRYGPVNLIAWSGDNSEFKIHPVGMKLPNSWNLYDMLGNVWEWVADFRGPYDSASVVDPKGPPTGSTHAKRGGGWHSATDPPNGGSYVRASSRSGPGDGPPGNVGFRCVAGF